MEKIEIIQKFLEGIVPEEERIECGSDPHPCMECDRRKSWNAARQEMLENIKSADIEKLIRELQ